MKSKSSWGTVPDPNAPWMPTTYRPNRCGYPLPNGEYCQMREDHYTKTTKDHGKPDYWANEKRCPNWHNHTSGVTFEFTGTTSGHHIFIETRKPCCQTHSPQ